MSMPVTRRTTLQAAGAAALAGAASGVLGAGGAGAEEQAADGNKDLTYTGTHASTSLLIGHDADHGIKGVTFENLVINGRVIRDSGGKPAWYLASDGMPMFVNDHVRNLRFLTTEEAAAL
jgi:hypothetical protein